jgi:hypothetical protein
MAAGDPHMFFIATNCVSVCVSPSAYSYCQHYHTSIFEIPEVNEGNKTMKNAVF